jgi:ATP-dependent DNA helicase RecQ
LLVPEALSQDDDPGATGLADSETSGEAIAARADISLRDRQTNDPQHFKTVVTTERNGILAAQRAALDRLWTALRGDRCISDVLADYYVVQSPNGPLRTSLWCRGCPHCRRDGPQDGFCRVGVQPYPIVPAWPSRPVDPLARFRGPDQSCLSIWWDSEQERRDLLPDLVTRLCRAGMPIIGGPGIDDVAADRIQREAQPHPVIFDRDEDLLITYTGPVIWVLDANAAPERALLGRIETSDVTYLLHARELRHPGKPGAQFAEIHAASISIRTARRAL